VTETLLARLYGLCRILAPATDPAFTNALEADQRPGNISVTKRPLNTPDNGATMAEEGTVGQRLIIAFMSASASVASQNRLHGRPRGAGLPIDGNIPAAVYSQRNKRNLAQIRSRSRGLESFSTRNRPISGIKTRRGRLVVQQTATVPRNIAPVFWIVWPSAAKQKSADFLGLLPISGWLLAAGARVRYFV